LQQSSFKPPSPIPTLTCPKLHEKSKVIAAYSRDISTYEKESNAIDKPKRPLSAYNLFFRDEREKIIGSAQNTLPVDDSITGITKSCSVHEGMEQNTLKENVSLKKKRGRPRGSNYSKKKAPHPKISFQKMAKMIGKKWQDQKNNELITDKYNDLAAKEKVRYKEEMVLYKTKMVQYVTKLPSSSAKTTNGTSQFGSCLSFQSSRNKQQGRKSFECSQCEINNQCDFHEDQQYYSHTQHFVKKDRNQSCHSMLHHYDPGFATENFHELKDILSYDKAHTSSPHYERTISNMNQAKIYENESSLHSLYSDDFDSYNGSNKSICMRSIMHETSNTATAQAQFSNSFTTFFGPYKSFEPQDYSYYKENDFESKPLFDTARTNECKKYNDNFLLQSLGHNDVA